MEALIESNLKNNALSTLIPNQTSKLKNLTIDKTWSLFLDRDGVINQRIAGDYVRAIQQFVWIKGVVISIVGLNKIFGHTFIVTNQQGIDKGLMTHEDLEEVHAFLNEQIEDNGGGIDKIYYAPQIAETNASMRKPNIGMALAAKDEFPNVEFSKSIMVGDSKSDMKFGRNAKMVNVFITGKGESIESSLYDFVFPSLGEFYEALTASYN